VLSSARSDDRLRLDLRDATRPGRGFAFPSRRQTTTGASTPRTLKLLGVASNIVTVPFRINGGPAQP